MRNLQGVEVGGRGLRLDFADTDNAGVKRGGAPERGGGGGGGGRDARDAGRGGGGGGGGYDGGSRRDVGPPPKPLPLGVPLQDGTSATDSISQTLATMPPGQLLDIMSQMKVGCGRISSSSFFFLSVILPLVAGWRLRQLFVSLQVLVTTSPFEARTLLASNPQLTYALFQAMLMMNIVDASILQVRPSLPPFPSPADHEPLLILHCVQKMLGSGVGAVKQEPYAQQPPPQAAYSNSYSSRPPPPTQQSNYPSYSTPPPAPVSQNYQQIQQQQQQQQRAPAPVAPPQDQAAVSLTIFVCWSLHEDGH